MAIGVMGCLTSMPSEFPDAFPENAGNMIHGMVPFELYDDAYFYLDDGYRASGRENFVDFVNSDCTHLVVTIANLLALNKDNPEQYSNFQRYLEQFKVPIVVFGLGAQAKSTDLVGVEISDEAIALMKFLGDTCEVVGVRGDFTARVFNELAGVSNTYVTGCPSFFQKPEAFKVLRENTRNLAPGKPSYNGTVFHNEVETRMLVNAIRAGYFLVEPVSKFNHRLYVEASRGDLSPTIPWYLKPYVGDGPDELSADSVFEYYSKNYRLFRNVKDWYRFNQDSVSFTFGSRFHVNMASILSGKPAIWLTHDTRTSELTEFLNLPNLPLEKASGLTADEIRSHMDYEPLFDQLHEKYRNFNEYLKLSGLPTVNLDF